MKTKTYAFNSDKIYITVIGDLHIGDKAFSKESERKLKGYIEWTRDNKDAYIFLNGDMMNTATRASKTSPFEQNMTLEEQINAIDKLFTPVKEKVLGAVDGNHERRLKDFVGYSPTISVCEKLKIPYFETTAILDFKLGKRLRAGKKKTDVSYVGVFQHTTGGGSTVGGKMNRVEKMRTSTITNADFYCGNHNHMLGVAIPMSYEYDSRNQVVVQRKQPLVDCGSYLDWGNSYAEAGQMAPMKLGSPRIRLDGKKKDIHVNF